jgi:DNA-3-methyladenine glycosylase II
MKTITLPRPRGFRLQAATDFYASFIPGSGMAAASVDGVTLVFRLDRTFEPAAVALREDGDALVAELAGTKDETRATRQVARILGLDVGGDGWLALGEREPVVGALQAEFPGFFTAAKPSPYDAAVWAVLAPRMHMSQAAKLKLAMADKLGDAVRLGDRVHHVFPSPEALARIDGFPGLPKEKLERLLGIAGAALAGKLDADRLREMDEDDALAELQTLRGVGPWAASHILFRGAAPPDGLPTAEPRVLHGLAAAYGIEAPSIETFRRIADGWRPFRMWVCILLARHLARVGGWRRPRLGSVRGLVRSDGCRSPPRARSQREHESL